MRIAVIGAGVSGLGAALALKEAHAVTLFEKDARLGGHANTVSIDYDGAPIDVDTGFIVYNELNYPNLTRLFAHLDVETIRSDMSFAVSDPLGFEWSSNGLGGLFAWKRNLARPDFLCMIGDIVRFSAAARADIANEATLRVTLEDYVAQRRLGTNFLWNYLLPMGAAIWSTPERDMLRYPAASFLGFFNNHRLLHTKRPKWRTVAGGSRVYVQKLARLLGASVRQGDPVTAVRRGDRSVEVTTASGSVQSFDQVVMACHSDQALALLSDANDRERSALSAIRYAPNRAYLHRDPKLMPKRRAAWSSWNFMRAEAEPGRVCVTYWMNALQKFDPARPLFVTLNPAAPPREELTFGAFDYDHPQFDLAAMQAQRDILGMQGARRTWFAGAWLGHGFHEDGLRSGLEVAERLGGRAPWHTPAAESAPLGLALPAPAAA